MKKILLVVGFLFLIVDTGWAEDIIGDTINGDLTVKGKITVVDSQNNNEVGFGMNSDPVRFLSADGVNSVVNNDPLELVWLRGSGVIVGQSSSNKFLKVHGKITAVDSQNDYEVGFGTNSDPVRFLSADGVNSVVNNDPLELVWLRGSGVVVGQSGSNKFLKVHGKIAAQEIEVIQNITANNLKIRNEAWTDYVFNEDYNLKSLIEVESFIKENKHLPDVPSAKEIKADGIRISEMMATQMKKIEELTLHLINMNKIMMTQNMRIAQLTEKIEKFEIEERN